jgi:hypothetical protein
MCKGRWEEAQEAKKGKEKNSKYIKGKGEIQQ